MQLRDKNILVFGLARSGVGAANLLTRFGAKVTVTDKKTEGELGECIHALYPSVKLCLGSHPGNFNGTDMIVVSPGVPLEIDSLVRAREKGIPTIGELELAYRIVTSNESQRGLSLFTDGAQRNRRIGTVPLLRPLSPCFLAVTGTNGKSTTATLLDLMLRKGGLSTIFGGNIGNALTEEIEKAISNQQSAVSAELKAESYSLNAAFIVAEVSSFQLESISEFKPAGATILNITPDHLDRYHSMPDYINAKCRLFENQGPDDFLVLNADDPMTGEIAKRIGRQAAKGKEMPRIYYFSRRNKVKGAYLSNGNMCFDLPGVSSSFSLHPSSFRIKGVHNLENAMASAAMALLAGCPGKAIEEALNEFPGLEHRLEFVRELEGVGYVNDSKGTNVGAVLKSIEGFSEPVILIAGGRDKESDFAQLRTLIKEKVKALILIGEAAGKMKAALGGFAETVLAADIKDAVEKARGLAKKGDVVLLSPACASFDMFRDFEDRGRQFKKIVTELS